MRKILGKIKRRIRRALRPKDYLALAEKALKSRDRELAIQHINAFVRRARKHPRGLVAMAKSYAQGSTIRDRDLAAFKYRVQIFRFLQGWNFDAFGKTVASRPSSKNPNSKTKIFVFWQQGFDSAPDIVQACVRQMKLVFKDHDLILLDQSNLAQWLEVEAAVLRNAGQHRAHFSDIIRAGLLAKHGGIWLDATVWVNTDVVPQLLAEARDTGFFTYRYSEARIASWLIVADQGNYATSLLYAVLCDYWSKNTELIGYFMFHDLFECIFFADQRFQQIVETSPFRDANLPHILQRTQLFKTYDERTVLDILQENPIQKLTHKSAGKNTEPDTTFAYFAANRAAAKPQHR